MINTEGKTPNAEQAAALEILKSGENVFLTGNAGTGKSFVTAKFMEWLEETGKRFVPMAFTGIAALNIGGQTIHRIFGIKAPKNSQQSAVLNPAASIRHIPDDVRFADTIIIDEVSMCRSDVFTYVMRCVESLNQHRDTPLQVVVVGDFCQLAPVVKPAEKQDLINYFGDVEGWPFKTQAWKNAKFRPVLLKTIVRQDGDDIEFMQNLDLARKGNITCLDYFNAHAVTSVDEIDDDKTTYLCNRNNTADARNKMKLDELGEYQYTSKARITGDLDWKCLGTTPYEFSYCVGAKVMMLVNDKDGRYVNGSVGHIVKCYEYEILVELDGDDDSKPHRVVCVGKNDRQFKRNEPVTNKEGKVIGTQEVTIGTLTQFPMRLAWAITIHKSQGMTLKGNVAVDTTCFADGQLYVALSRCTSIKNMTLFPPATPKNLHANADVVRLYNIVEHLTSKKDQK